MTQPPSKHARNALKPRQSNPSESKARATPPDPHKTGWIAFAKERPPSGDDFIFGWYSLSGEWNWSSHRLAFATHWLALPNPPKRKGKVAKAAQPVSDWSNDIYSDEAVAKHGGGGKA